MLPAQQLKQRVKDDVDGLAPRLFLTCSYSELRGTWLRRPTTRCKTSGFSLQPRLVDPLPLCSTAAYSAARGRGFMQAARHAQYASGE